MNLKKIGISVLFGIVLTLALMAGWKIGFSEYSVQYSVIYQNPSNAQIFWSTESEGFTEKNAHLLDIKAGGEYNLEFNIDKESNRLRIDLGYGENEIAIYNAKIVALGDEAKLDDGLIVEKNQIEEMQYTGESYVVKTTGDDPYVVFDIKPILNAFSQRQNVFNNVLRGFQVLLGIISAIVVFAKYNKVKGLIFWLLGIVKEWKLIWKLALNDFKMRYVTSYLGTVWAFVQPIVTTTIYVLVFGLGFKSLPVEGVSFAVWLTTGIVPWFFFQDAWMNATNSLLEYSYLVKKVVFKINVLPMVKIIAAIFVHLFFIAIAIVLQCIYGMPIKIQIVQLPYYTLCVIVLVLGASYITSALVVFLKDIGQIVGIFLQFGMWLTPIMYQADMFGPMGEKILMLNPMFYVVDGYRDALFQGGWFWEKPGLTLYFWCVTGILLIIGIKIFKSLEKHFADVL